MLDDIDLPKREQVKAVSVKVRRKLYDETKRVAQQQEVSLRQIVEWGFELYVAKARSRAGGSPSPSDKMVASR
jgi:hypothetical protein